MNWKGIHISDAARLWLKQGQLCIEQAEYTRTAPLEDVAFMVLEMSHTTLTAPLLSACAAKGCLIITTDERHMPNGTLLPFHPFYQQAETLEAQIALSEPRKKRLWQMLVQTKIRNQSASLARLGVSERMVARVAALEQKVRSGDPDNVEAHAARLYWSGYTPKFTRNAEGEDRLNALLNYGYALVRALIARELAAYGFAPCLGLHHKSRQNAFNLADDLIEPWRPVVDVLAMQRWRKTEQVSTLEKADRQAMCSVFYEKVYVEEGEYIVLDGVKKQVEQVRACYLGRRKEIPCPSFPA